MIRYAFVDSVFTGGVIVVLPGQPFTDPRGRQYGRRWLEKSTPEQRAAIALQEVIEAPPVPSGKVLISEEIRAVNGVPQVVRTLEDKPLEQRKSDLLAAIDEERDRRQQLDFTYDFGETLAIDDDQGEIAAGVRSLQMRFSPDQRNWQALQSTALAAIVSGQGAAIMPMRAEDNWNVQTTALQVQTVAAAMVARNAAILFAGGALKSQVRAAANPAALAAIDITIGWP